MEPEPVLAERSVCRLAAEDSAEPEAAAAGTERDAVGEVGSTGSEGRRGVLFCEGGGVRSAMAAMGCRRR